MSLYRRKGTWYMRYSLNGRLVRKSTETSDRQIAEAKWRDIQLTLANARPSKKELKEPTPAEPTFDTLLKEYLDYSRANKMPNTFRRDKSLTGNLLKRFKAMPLTKIAPVDLEHYKNNRVIEGAEPGTVNREITCIKHMFNMAVEWNLLKDNHLRRVKKLKEPPGRVRYLSQDEIKRLFAHLADHLKPIVLMALNTAMRKNEILSLTWKDVDLEKKQITVKGTKAKTKATKMRVIPMTKALFGTVQGLKDSEGSSPDDYVFQSKNGKRYSDIKTGFNAAIRRAGIKDFRFHDLRHTCASYLVMSGVDIRTVQEILGHTDIKMTMRYSHLSTEHLQEAMKKLEKEFSVSVTDTPDVKKNLVTCEKC